MDLERDDFETIAAYIRMRNPDYKGAIFIDLERLRYLHMDSSLLKVHYALSKIKYGAKK